MRCLRNCCSPACGCLCSSSGACCCPRERFLMLLGPTPDRLVTTMMVSLSDTASLSALDENKLVGRAVEEREAAAPAAGVLRLRVGLASEDRLDDGTWAAAALRGVHGAAATDGAAGADARAANMLVLGAPPPCFFL